MKENSITSALKIDYAPASETDLTHAVALRSEITRMLNFCTLNELELIKKRVIETHVDILRLPI